MEHLGKHPYPTKHTKYHKLQELKGFVRFELQIEQATKEKFNSAASAIAEEYTFKTDPKRRLAKAKAVLFKEMLSSVTHHYFELEDKIAKLKYELALLSPTFEADISQVSLPEAIANLPNDPLTLKKILATTYRETQILKKEATNANRDAERFEALYEASTRENEEIKAKLFHRL